jgi:hypothetical protein
VIASNAIRLEGTLYQINTQLRYMYFFAASGYGSAETELTMTLTDRPIACHPMDELKSPRTAQQALYSFGSWTVNSTNTANISLCDLNSAQTTIRTIAMYIKTFNRPPSLWIDGGNDTTVKTKLNAYATLPVISVSDPDVSQSDEMQVMVNTSYGEINSPPVSFVINLVGLGRVSLTRQEGLVFVHGSGDLSRQISLRGSIADINNALLNMWYICRSQDGCSTGTNDVLMLLVDDDGFKGLGGPLQASAQINIEVK